MIFIGLFLCVIALIVFFIKLNYVLTGKIAEGKIVGYVRGTKGLYGFEGYNYRVLLEYNGETYYVTSIDSIIVTNRIIPRKNLGMQCLAYFNPKSRTKKVALKGFHQIEWFALLLFLLGALTIILELFIIL